MLINVSILQLLLWDQSLIFVFLWCLKKKDFIYKKCMLDINALIQIRTSAKQCWSRSNIFHSATWKFQSFEKGRAMRKDGVSRVRGLLHTVLWIGLALTQGLCFLLESRSDRDTRGHKCWKCLVPSLLRPSHILLYYIEGCSRGALETINPFINIPYLMFSTTRTSSGKACQQEREGFNCTRQAHRPRKRGLLPLKRDKQRVMEYCFVLARVFIPICCSIQPLWHSKPSPSRNRTILENLLKPEC